MRVPKEYSTYEEVKPSRNYRDIKGSDNRTAIQNRKYSFNYFYAVFLTCKVLVILIHYLIYILELNMDNNKIFYWWFGNPEAFSTTIRAQFILTQTIIFIFALPTEKWILNYYFKHSSRPVLFGMAILKLIFVFSISCWLTIYGGATAGEYLFSIPLIIAALTLFTIIESHKNALIYIGNSIMFGLGVIAFLLRITYGTDSTGSIQVFNHSFLNIIVKSVDWAAMLCSLIYPLVVYVVILVLVFKSKKKNRHKNKRTE